MIRLKNNDKIKEVEKTPTPTGQTQGNSTLRPEVVNAKVYKLKSAFVKNAVFITREALQSRKHHIKEQFYVQTLK